MFRLKVALLSLAVFGTTMLSLSAGSGSCINSCNSQYSATIKYCTTALAKDGRRDVFNDCVKSAERFRLECLGRCR